MFVFISFFQNCKERQTIFILYLFITYSCYQNVGLLQQRFVVPAFFCLKIDAHYKYSCIALKILSL